LFSVIVRSFVFFASRSLSSASHTTSFAGGATVAEAVTVADAVADAVVTLADAVVVGFFEGGGDDSPHAANRNTANSALFMMGAPPPNPREILSPLRCAPRSSFMAEGFLTC